MSIDAIPPEHLARLLDVLPRWRHDAGAGTLERRYVFPNARVAQAFGRYVLALAESRRTYPRLAIAERELEIRLDLGDRARLEASCELAMALDAYS